MTFQIDRIRLAVGVSITMLGLLVACGGGATQVTSPTPTDQAVPTRGPFPSSVSQLASSQTPPPSQAPQPTSPNEPSDSAELPTLMLEQPFQSLPFSRLTNLVPEGDRFFVTEQIGRVISLRKNSDSICVAVFLDIQGQVSTAGNEEGLLGLAFDPQFESNGHFYVYYSAADPRRSVISRFTVGSPDAIPAQVDSELVILEIPQPFRNHNGGQLAFGPDGMLYISLGDGGGGGDPQGNGQNTSTLLGSILRIDVSGVSSDNGYRVPLDNPFVDLPGARGEIWAYGLRNPWRFSFDRQTGDMWAGDVGQNSYEEVDLVVRGGNYGWNVLEGRHCFSPRTGCDDSGTILPVIEYGSNRGCSVIGGYVYRGEQIPSLDGAYIYGDFCSGEIHGFRFEKGEVAGHSLLVDSGLMITSFGEDRQGEIYVLSQEGGIYHLALGVR